MSKHHFFYLCLAICSMQNAYSSNVDEETETYMQGLSKEQRSYKKRTYLEALLNLNEEKSHPKEMQDNSQEKQPEVRQDNSKSQMLNEALSLLEQAIQQFKKAIKESNSTDDSRRPLECVQEEKQNNNVEITNTVLKKPRTIRKTSHTVSVICKMLLDLETPKYDVFVVCPYNNVTKNKSFLENAKEPVLCLREELEKIR